MTPGETETGTGRGIRTGADVLRDVVAALAPDELDRLDEARRTYAEDPYPPQRVERGGGGVLTAGVDTAVLLPVLIAFVAQFLADVAADAVRRGGGALSRRRARRRRRREAAGERRTALTDEAPDPTAFPTDDLLRWAGEHARDCGFAGTEADRCAHVVVIALTGGPTEPPPQPPPQPAQPAQASEPPAPAGPSSNADGN
ncbi:hypothetical protein [Streptomyces qinzhouensis]|uniref:Uncharacterized protein n=1 Tax=Streptomyces qinzhouensis TaxID=2599401 RepID=A0A5B8JCF4_9ACTN|nr:hypothetical protein [Streptomyces qinzhouensis]QDY79016.1 hypothetical protein FQU76_23650 [Streptomyces qinzhouensis]